MFQTGRIFLEWIKGLSLALGAAQFGQTYGIANTAGRPSLSEIGEIVHFARESGITLLDTAIAYGESEARLGTVGMSAWQVVSKLPVVPEEGRKVLPWVQKAVRGSLERLKIDRLYGLLLHSPQQLLAPSGDILFRALCQLKSAGYVEKIGVSIYDPVELEVLCGRYQFDLVQSPFSLLDRRLLEGGWLGRLQRAGIELHVRSIFLQGLLLMEPGGRPGKFERWVSIWNEQAAW